MKRKFIPAALLALGLSLGVGTLAQAHDDKKDHGARVEKHMQQAAERLALSEEQKQQLRPLVEEHLAKAKAIRDRYPAEASREQKRQMFDEMRSVRDDYDGKVRAVLSEEQRQEWDKMQSERRDRMRRHAKDSRQDREET